MAQETTPQPRPVRSFVRRHGRMTRGQRRALDEHACYLIPPGTEPLDPARAFGREAPLWVEIGFGNGDTLCHLAESRPQTDFLGIEVHEPGIGHLLLSAASAGLGNVRVAAADAREFVTERLPDAAAERILVLFPDPWPKKRHRKRRLVQGEFAAVLARKLAPGGVLHAATDWADYAEHMLAELESVPTLSNLAGPGRYAKAPGYRVTTRFERRGLALGHDVRDLLFARDPVVR